MLRLLALLLVPITAVVVVFAFRPAAARPAAGPWNRPLAERRADPFPRRFLDPSGSAVSIPRPPERIVSGTIFADAVLLAICPRARIRALIRLSEDARYSPVAAESRAFRRHVGGDPEEILEQRPDLVIVSSFSRRRTRDLLGRASCAVVRLVGFSSVEDIQSNTRALGYVLGLDAAAERLVSGMQARLHAVAEHAARRRVWRVLLYALGRTGGRETTFGSLLRHVGARNAADELGLLGAERITTEQVLALDPDALVLGALPGHEEEARERLLQVPGLRQLAAVRRGRLLFVPNAWLLSTSHHAAKAAERIAEVLDRWGRP